MNGPQDLGGQMGFGPVAPEKDEPYFHAAWERRALGVTLTAGGMGAWSIDESRHARESLHPADYYASSYYQIWIKALETLLKRHGFVTERDLAAGKAVDAAATPKRVLKASDVPAVLAKGGPCDRPVATPARFRAGDRVRTKNFQPDRTYAPATLCARQKREDRGRSRRLRLSRQQRAWQGREPAMGLYRGVRRAWDLGRGGRSHAQHLDRCLGELS